MGSNKIPETSSKFTYDTSYKKPDVPKPKEKPIMGLSSRKKFHNFKCCGKHFSSSKSNETRNYMDNKERLWENSRLSLKN